MWTQLIAGTTAHEINNLVQGLLNARMLFAQPGATPESLARLTAQADEQLAALQELARALHALALCGGADAAGAHPLDLIFSDAATEIDAGDERSVVVDGAPAGASVRGTADALRTAIRALLRHALAASAPGGAVHLGASLEPGTAVVTVEAPSAPSPGVGTPAALVQLPRANELRASFGVVLAGALAAALGGELGVGRGATGGLRFALRLPRAA